jgi:long-chain acyl-CoA synthetase
MNIVQIIRHETAHAAGKTALVDGDRSITYGQLLDQVTQLTLLLKSKNIGPGQRIAFHCGDGIDYVIGSLALLECKAAVVPVADNLIELEALEIIDRVDVHGILIHHKITRIASEQTAGEHTAGEQTAEKVDAVFSWQPRPARGDSDDRCRALGAAFIRFSSGTTGQSKGVVLSHQSILDRTDAANRGLQITEQDVILWVLGMSYHFVVSILLFLRKAATIVVANQFFPFSLLDAATKHSATFIYASPVHYHFLGQSDAVATASLSKVRLAISTAMKMPTDVSLQFSKKFGFAPAEAYGIIEIGLPFINTQPRSVSPGSPGTVGRVLPDYQLQIRNPDAEGIGEVLITGKGMFDAYFSPWRSRAECTDAGWFHTGDLGRLDESSQLQLVGRSKTVLVCAGMKVFPEEVEQAINSMPGIKESMVLGREHPQFGQVPIARVVLAETADPQATLVDLRPFCCQKLSAYKVPVEFIPVDSLPRTASGKISRSNQSQIRDHA